MARAIYKYQVEATPGRHTPLQLPAQAKLLDVQVQNGFFVLWALVDDEPGRERTERRILPLFTGPNDVMREVHLEHISTVQVGGLVWHFFEVVS